MSLACTNKTSNFSLVCMGHIAGRMKAQAGTGTEKIRVEMIGNLKILLSATSGVGT